MTSQLLTGLFLKLALLVILGTTFSCQNLLDSDPLTDVVQLSGPNSTEKDTSTSQEGEAFQEDVWALDNSGEFCKDDVYGRYLREQYFTINKSRAHRYRSSRSRRLYQNRRDVQGSHYAREIISGTETDYFGDLPITMNPQVEYWLQYFKTRGRQTFLKWAIRAASVADMVRPILKQERLPKELFFLAMIESGFNFRARSHARAMGPWQFMSATGKVYGLDINYWVDERNDPIKSTLAAATLLKDLYEQFGDWYLAMAAYNAGPAKVRRAIRKTKSRDFWKLAETRYLRVETKQYIPKLLAAVILSSDLEGNGFKIKPSDIEKFPGTFASFKRAVRISEIAKKIGLPSSLIRKWNPELIKGIVPPQKVAGQEYKLRLPATYVAKLNPLKSQLTYLAIRDVKLHKIRPGDTLYAIARKYKVRLRSIQSMNPKLSAKRLRPGKKIAIPIPEVVELKNQQG